MKTFTLYLDNIGNLSIEYSHQLDDNDRQHLQELGFCVTFNGSITGIKW